jgi:DNA-damage-inducible protein D
MPDYDDYRTRLDRIRRLAPDESEYWMARELQGVLEYERWENFTEAIWRAMEACASAHVPVENHFRETTKMIQIGKGGKRETTEWYLSKYACSLIAMNADADKPAVAYAQTYFAIQTHLQEQQNQLSTVERRRLMRERVKDANLGLNSAAKDAGVQRYAIFHDAGYKGLYGGLNVSEIKQRKGINAKDDLLDCVDHTELAANYFRITQAQQKIAQQRVQDERIATETHKQAGQEVREAMKRISGIVPENLPAAPNLKKLKAPKQKSNGLLDG